MADKKYVPEGVYLACDKGTCPSQFRISQRTTTIFGKPLATEADLLPFFNIKPMGFCSAKFSVCMPAAIMWENPQEGITVGGFRLLTEESTTQCAMGGKIDIHFTRESANNVAIWGGVKMPTEYIKEGFDWVFEEGDAQRAERDKNLPGWMQSIAHANDWMQDLSVGLVEGAVTGVVGMGEMIYQVGQDPVGTAEAIGGMASSAWDATTEGVSNAAEWASEGENWSNAADSAWNWASEGENWSNAAGSAWESTQDAANWVAENPRRIGTTVGEFIPDAVAIAYTGGGALAATGARAAGREVVEEGLEYAVREGLEEAGERAVREGVEEAGERAARETAEEVAEEAIEEVAEEIPEVVVRQADDMTPGSPAHKAQRWEDYQARGGEWDYDRWSKTYEGNMVRARRANQAVDDYHETLGWGRREVTVDVNGQPRRLDIADVADRRGVEMKSGEYFSRTEDIMSEIARDRQLVQDGWDIDWVIEGRASQPLLDELSDAGINVIQR